MKIDVLYLEAYYPTADSDTIWYRERLSTINVSTPKVSEKEFPIIIQCEFEDDFMSRVDFIRAYNGTVLRGYQGHLMRSVNPSDVKDWYRYDDDLGILASDQFKRDHIDPLAHPYTKLSVDIPDCKVPQDMQHTTRTALLKKAQKDYEGCVLLDGQLWIPTTEPYIEVDQYTDRERVTYRQAFMFPNAKNALDYKNLKLRIDDYIAQFKTDDMWERFSLHLSDDYAKYLHESYPEF